MTNDWIPSVDELRTVSGNAGPGKCWEAIRALVASRVPKVREEIAAAYDRGFTQGQKFTPARESVDVEPSISEMRAAYYKAIGSSTVNGSSPTPSLDAGMAALRSLCRSRTTAPPRDSSPAASGEEPFAPKSKNALRMTMEFRPEMTDLEKAVAGFEAAREFDKLVMARWTRKSAKFTAPDEAAKPIFDALVDAYEKGVADHVARDSSAAESGRAASDAVPPGWTRCRQCSKPTKSVYVPDEICMKCGDAKYLKKEAPPTPAAPEAKNAPESSPDDEVQWVVNNLGELGVLVAGRFHFLYKGRSIRYDELERDEDDLPLKWRHVGKREFGETCQPMQLTKLTEVYDQLDGSGGRGWQPLPTEKPASAPISTDEGEMSPPGRIFKLGDDTQFIEAVNHADVLAAARRAFEVTDELNRRAPAPEAERAPTFDECWDAFERAANLELKDSRVSRRAADREGVAAVRELFLGALRNLVPALLALARGEESEGGK